MTKENRNENIKVKRENEQKKKSKRTFFGKPTQEKNINKTGTKKAVTTSTWPTEKENPIKENRV